jgi:aspartate aminotransferase-like enzyme
MQGDATCSVVDSAGADGLSPRLLSFFFREVGMAGRNFLFVPGPTNTPDRVLRAMHRAMEDHRSSDFPSLAAPVLEDLKQIFKTTSGQAFVFPASGTGAWEA